LNASISSASIPSELLSSKVLIVGTVRNAGEMMVSDIEKLSKAFALFKDVHWLIIESDSTDNTLDRLAELKQSVAHFNFLSLGQLEPHIPLRTERIAHCRNTYLDDLRNNPAYADVKFLVVADLDNTQVLTTQEGVMSCFARADWGGCTANQEGLYYDIWALRHPVWSPNDCWEQKFFFEKANLSKEKAAYSAVFSRMIEIPPTASWIEVDSSFGGLGIYKTEFLGDARYVGRADNNLWGGQVCEHVAFHASLKTHGAKLFINPQMLNAALNEHTLQIIVPEDLLFPVNLKQAGKDTDNDAGTKEGQLNVMTMTHEDIIGAYKVFLKRHPETPNVVQPRVGMTSDMVLVDFLTSGEFLNRSGVDKLMALVLKKMPVDKIPIDYLKSPEFWARADVKDIVAKMPGLSEAPHISLDMLTSEDFLSQEGVDQLIVQMLEKYLALVKIKNIF
jgi:hypothetical protein